jgi:prepilin-type N-terminal cleavage/methylation domain-containing protein
MSLIQVLVMRYNHLKTCPVAAGVTLLELMVVLVIISILAGGSVMMFRNPTAKVRSAIFSIQGDINLARSEAVNRNRDVLVDFTLGSEEGYQLCLDTDSDRDCSDEASADIIRKVVFGNGVRFYDCTAAPPFPAGGPTRTSSGTTLAGKNGLIFGGPTYIKMQPDGTSSDNGSIIVYCPDYDNPMVIRGDPYAAVISSASTGRIRVLRWRRDKGWSKK